MPDLIHAGLEGTPLEVRAPDAIRPWQHVLNPLYGYLLLAHRPWDGTYATAWNFGPHQEESHPVAWVVERMRTRCRARSRRDRRATANPRRGIGMALGLFFGSDRDDDAARDPDEVEEQLAAFRKWGSGGEFANYAYNGLDAFDYTPYVPALRSASTPGQVDSAPPRLSVTQRTKKAGGRRLTLRGSATDNLAIRAVRWRDDRGHSGVMPLRWTVESGDAGLGLDSRMLWTARSIPLSQGATTISVTAEDIKGLTTIRTVRVRRRPALAFVRLK